MHPLYHQTAKALQDAALREFRSSQLGRLVRDLRGARSSYNRSRVSRLVGEITRSSARLERYAKRSFLQSVTDRAVAAIVEELGPLAPLLHALGGAFGGGGGRGRRSTAAGAPDPRRRFDQEIATAIQFLEAFGYTVTPPTKSTGDPLVDAGLVNVPEQHRPRIAPPERAPQVSPLPTRTGGRRQWPADHPIMTGEMVEVDSSNVHSIGYEFNPDSPARGTLKIRFLQSKGRGNAKGPGPLYHYAGVNPNVFEAFLQAASKGRFVWDRIRIRGTVSGHRYHYELKGIVNGVVPRKATRLGPNEYFIGRRLEFTSQKTGQTREFTSQLPDQFVGQANAQRTNFGIPNRGAPNRGAPNRGRRE